MFCFVFQVEVMIIVEYCRFGNLRSFLITQRDHFIDQINHDDDTIDATIAGKKNEQKNVFKTTSDHSNILMLQM